MKNLMRGFKELTSETKTKKFISRHNFSSCERSQEVPHSSNYSLVEKNTKTNFVAKLKLSDVHCKKKFYEQLSLQVNDEK